MKLDLIKKIITCSNQRYIIIDSSRKAILVSQEIKMIVENIKTFKQIFENDFLIGLQNFNRLDAINSFNELKTALPLCFYISQNNNNNVSNNSESIETISNQLFNNTLLLNELISSDNQNLFLN